MKIINNKCVNTCSCDDLWVIYLYISLYRSKSCSRASSFFKHQNVNQLLQNFPEEFEEIKGFVVDFFNIQQNLAEPLRYVGQFLTILDNVELPSSWSKGRTLFKFIFFSTMTVFKFNGWRSHTIAKKVMPQGSQFFFVGQRMTWQQRNVLFNKHNFLSPPNNRLSDPRFFMMNVRGAQKIRLLLKSEVELFLVYNCRGYVAERYIYKLLF